MIRTAGIRDDVLVTLTLVGDLTYAWEIVDTFTVEMQEGIKKDASLVGKLRATFLKVQLLISFIKDDVKDLFFSACFRDGTPNAEDQPG